MSEFKLGYTYEDRITGFSGVATGLVRYISGCNQVYLTPRVDSDGKPRDGAWFDEQRLAIENDLEDPIVLDNSKTPGFGASAPAYK